MDFPRLGGIETLRKGGKVRTAETRESRLEEGGCWYWHKYVRFRTSPDVILYIMRIRVTIVSQRLVGFVPYLPLPQDKN